MSLCGHVFNYTPSTKVSSSVLSKAGLNENLCYNQKIPLDFQVRPGSGNATPLHSSSDSPTSQCENSNRLIFSRLGCNYGACQNSRSLGVGKTVVPHKQEKTPNLFHCAGIFVPHLRDIHVQLRVDNTVAVSYLNHAGGTRSQTLSDLAIAIWESMCSQRNIYLSAIHIPGIVNKTPDGLSHQKLESTKWMLRF